MAAHETSCGEKSTRKCSQLNTDILARFNRREPKFSVVAME